MAQIAPCHQLALVGHSTHAVNVWRLSLTHLPCQIVSGVLAAHWVESALNHQKHAMHQTLASTIQSSTLNTYCRTLDIALRTNVKQQLARLALTLVSVSGLHSWHGPQKC